jgi:hypothetical protein
VSLFLGLCPSASAEPEAPRTEYFTGFEASDNYASAYVGGGYALGKAGLHRPGFRLRAVGAYGRYHYDGTLTVDGIDLPQAFNGEVGYLAALAGYQFHPDASSSSCSPASRLRTSSSCRTIRIIRCRARRSA